jgi:hypothetical protein
MGAPKGHRKWGGRAKGTPNKKTQELLAICFEEGLDVWRAMIKLAKEGEPHVKQAMLKELAQYLFPKRKAIELSGEVGLPEPTIKEESLEDRVERLKGK